jgi:hypothetical protein
MADTLDRVPQGTLNVLDAIAGSPVLWFENLGWQEVIADFIGRDHAIKSLKIAGS